MPAPALRLDEAVIGRTADAVGQPLGEGALVGRRPAAVVLEPGVGVGDRRRRVARLAHAAVIARELGLSGVIGAAGAMDDIPDGALVEVDPVAGRVRVLSTTA